MGLRPEGWVSAAVSRDKEVHAAVHDIRRLVRKYGDAGSPALSRKPEKLVDSFLTAQVGVFRPNWTRFLAVTLLFAVSALAYLWAGGQIDAVAWADLSLKTVIPIFVLGIAVVNLSRSLSAAGRFTGEYLNETCEMTLFSCLAFLTAMTALMGWVMGKTHLLFEPILSPYCVECVAGSVAAASFGATMMCLVMLAFITIETIRCFIPSKAIKAVSRFAGAKLWHAYLREVYGRVLTTQHNAYLERWCEEHCKAIHPPSQYYGRYLRVGDGSDKGSNAFTIQLKKRPSDAKAYKDFHLGRLAEVEIYLIANSAELYLSSPQYDSEHKILGILSFPDITRSGVLGKDVERMGNRAVRWRSLGYATEEDAVHQSHLNTLETALCTAIENGETQEVTNYLQVATGALSMIRQVKGWRVIREADRPSFIGYDFVRLYVVAIQKLLNTIRDGAEYPPGRASELARAVRKSIWEETRDIGRDLDYHAMELFAWVIPQIYRIIIEAGEKAGPLQSIRAEFGGFYAFADGWLADTKTDAVGAAEQMRLVLQDGLTKWLLMTIQKKDGDLTEQLCDALRAIVFGHKGDVTLGQGALVVRHFVLAGYLIGQAKTDDIKPTAIERLFAEHHGQDSRAKFDDLVTFYRANSFPRQCTEEYLRIFYKPKRKTTDLLTGSSQSSGFGMTGQRQMALAFIYVGACALADSIDEPQVIPEDVSFELKDDVIETVADLFKGEGLDHDLQRLKAWRDQCTQSSDEAKAKAIADAEFNPSMIEQWRKEFWETYSTSSPVLSLCIRNGNYEIVSTACTGTLRYDLPKIAVIDWKYPISAASGNDYARGFAERMEGQLLAKMLGKSRSASPVEGTLSDLMKKAAAWLRRTGCENENGMIVAMTKHGPASQLFRDKGYVPSWREDVQSRGFEGFYEGFPLVWCKEIEGAEGAKPEQRESSRERVVAVDLRGWKGVRVRERVIAEREFGELTIRPWTEEETQKALESKKLEPKDVNKAKGNCPVDICLYWELSSSRPPHRRAFQTRVTDGEVPSKDNSEPAEQ